MEVDAVLNNMSSDTDAVLVGYTPTVLRDLGVPSLPLVVGRGHVYTMAKTEAEAKAENRYARRANYHGLGDTVVKNLYQYISNPVMVIASKDVSNKFPARSQRSVVAIIDIGYSDESMLIPVEITAERGVNGEQMDVNVMSSAYTRGVQNLIEKAIAQENTGESGIFYIKNEAASKVAGRLQLPTQPTKATTSGIILHYVGEKVNLKIQNQTQTAQFARWFGDWQNEPSEASKVVNANGTPKIVYHGTDRDFNVFQSESGAYWFSESEDYAESMMEERGGAQIEIVESIVDGSAGKYLDGKIQVNAEKLREDRAGTLRTVVMHEMTHHIETSGQYEDLRKGIESYLRSKGIDVEYELEALAEEYEENGVDINEDDQLWREYVAKNVEMLLSDEDSVRYLARENRGLFDKIREFLRDLVTKLKGTQDEKTVRELLKIYDLALDAVDAKPENRYKGEQNLFVGKAADGTEVYETSEAVKKLPYADRKVQFLDLMKTQYAGRTAKFTRNGHTYYALFDENDVRKNIYGDAANGKQGHSDAKGWKAKINTGADGNIFELVENAQWSKSRPETGKSNKAHKQVSYWDYYVKTV